MRLAWLVMVGGLSLAGPLAVRAQVQVSVEAAAGEPLGVGRVVFEADRRGRSALAAGEPLTIKDAAGRLWYPVVDRGADSLVRGLLREVAPPRRRTAWFVFRGAEPLELTSTIPAVGAIPVVPVRDAALHRALLDQWWQEWASTAERAMGEAPYPAVVENYLRHTVGRQLGRDVVPAAGSGQWAPVEGALGLLAGSERSRLRIQERLLAGGVQETASEALPDPGWTEAEPIEVPEEVVVEPIALRVPGECFYVRCGSFANFQWLRERLNAWGGDVRNLVAQREYDYRVNERLERRLALRESALSKLLGPAVIADVAVIGTDTFVREGGAVGILFQARNNLALSTDFAKQRKEALAREAGSVEESLTVQGRSVSLIRSPRGELRSFYVADGDFHLVTSSRALVERFLETGREGASLGHSPAFRWARRRGGAGSNESLFVYLSERFFRNLAGPHYQVELRRRASAAAEMDLVHLARLHARAEGRGAGTVAELVVGGYLPRGFGQRADGSSLVEEADGGLVDSLRGGRGSFVPIPDVPMERVTPQEAAEYRELAGHLGRLWGPAVPVMVRVARAPAEGGRERVRVEAEVAPLAPRHEQLLAGWIGPPVARRLAPVASDLISFQASVGGVAAGGGEPHLLFGAVRDAAPLAGELSLMTLIGPLLGLEQVQGYLGAWPHPGLLELVPDFGVGRADAAGYARLLGGVWRRDVAGFTLLSFHQQVLAEVSPQLRLEPAERPGQLWLRAGDLAGSQVAGVVNAWGYRHARQSSAGNAALLQVLANQLHVPQDSCLAEAERLLDARMVCPLGGEYVAVGAAGRPERWTTTAAGGEPATRLPRRAPAGYTLEALTWIKRLDLELRLEGGALAVHLEADLPGAGTGGAAAGTGPSGPREF